MYRLRENISLKERNSFGISVTAKLYLTIDSPEDLIQFFGKNNYVRNERKLFLGAGSNLLFIGDFQGIVIHPEIHDIRLVSENKFSVEVEAGAGLTWDHFVALCVGKGWGGIENLSLIPGNIGAVPVQNIGAYGVEAASVISRVQGIDLNTLEIRYFSNSECNFGYRTSIFKEQLKENFIITSVVFKLSKQSDFQLHYKGLEKEVNNYGETNIGNIRKAVIAIRESKLPDPMKVGNAGSFFKNPVIAEETAAGLINLYPDIPIYNAGPGYVKISAGWLIEKTGWKGKAIGKSAVHEHQALVIINLGGASGKEIFELSEIVSHEVLQKFNIKLEREVQVIGE